LCALAGTGEFSVAVLSSILEPYASRIRELGVPIESIPRRSGIESGRALTLARRLRALGTDIAHAVLDSSDAYHVSRRAVPFEFPPCCRCAATG
jgi:hypothetical protein